MFHKPQQFPLCQSHRDLAQLLSLKIAGLDLDATKVVSSHPIPVSVAGTPGPAGPKSHQISWTVLRHCLCDGYAEHDWPPCLCTFCCSTCSAALECWTRELACHLGPEGHRVNAISSGPIRTIAASGIPGFDNILNHVADNAPLRRNVTQSDVAGTTLWLASPLSAGVTGQVIHVDAGYSITMVPGTIME